MRRLALLLFAALLAYPVHAEPLPPGSLIAAISLDWNGDVVLDAATLTRAGDGMADLTLYRGGGIHGLDPILTLRGAVFAGPMAGQAPAFEARTPTSFGIATQQIGVGRLPWHQRVTIAYRDGDFLVAGYTYTFYDRLDLGHHGVCDVNLLTGDYEIRISRSDTQPDGTAIEDSATEETFTGRTGRTAFPLADLREGFAPTICDELFR